MKMTNQEKVKLLDSLNQNIEKWLEGILESDHNIGYVAYNISYNMAVAAHAVLINNAELYEYLDEQELLQ